MTGVKVDLIVSLELSKTVGLCYTLCVNTYFVQVLYSHFVSKRPERVRWCGTCYVFVFSACKRDLFVEQTARLRT